MNIKSTLVLTLILAMLGAYLYFFEYKDKQEQLTQEQSAKKVIAMSSENVDTISYSNKLQNAEAVFVKKDNEWFLSEPVQYKADSTAIVSMIGTAFESTFDERVENPQNLEEFGLNDPQIKITFKSAAGQETLSLGDKSPTETNIYVMTDKSDDIFLLPISSYYSLDKKLTDLRNKDILAYNRDNISFLKVDNPNGSFSLVKENNNWLLDLPNKLTADQEKVNELFDKIQETKISDFVEDKPESLSSFGLDKPFITVSMGGNKDSLNHSLLLGDETGDYNFAKNNETNSVFKLNKSFSEKFKGVDFMFFRNKTILSFEKEKINKVDIESVGKKVTGEKKDGKWEIQGQEPTMNPDDLQVFVDKLSNLTFERTFSRNNFSLGDRIINVTLYSNDETAPVKITFGGVTSDNPDQVYLLNHAENQEAYAVNKSILDKVMQ